MSKMVSLRVDEALLAWADEYAASRGVSRTVLLENALLSFQEDCRSGVPDLRERIKAVTGATAPKDGERICPELPQSDGSSRRGFRQKCPVHGAAVVRDAKGELVLGEDGLPVIDVEAVRAKFLGATEERSGLFARLRTPESIKAGRPRSAKREARDGRQ